jgi:hypothetical protein
MISSNFSRRGWGREIPIRESSVSFTIEPLKRG